MKKQRISTAQDGETIEGYVEGAGPSILFLHPGMDDGKSWSRVTKRLADRFRTVRLLRRTYRLDLEIDPSLSLAAEVADVLAAADALDTPLLLVGHSSGGVVALEALLAAPSKFAAAVIYEAPIPVEDLPGGEALPKTKAALAGKGPGAAIKVFMREIVGYPAWLSWILGALVGAFPSLRARVPRQLADYEAIVRNGVRLNAYATIGVPVLMLLGERSPSNLAQRTRALEETIPEARIIRMAGRGHAANRRASALVARLIADFHREVVETGRRPEGESAKRSG